MDYVVIDFSDGEATPPYWRQVRDQMRAVLEAAPERYEELLSVGEKGDGFERPIEVYRLKYRSPGPRKKLRLDLSFSLGKTLER